MANTQSDFEKAQASAAMLATVMDSIVPAFMKIHNAIHGTKPKKKPKAKKAK